MKTVYLLALVLISDIALGGEFVRTESTLTQDAGREIAVSALKRCREGGFHVSVTVLNRAGRELVVLHDDGANPHTIENSLRKAWTALTFKVTSGEWGKKVMGNPSYQGALNLKNVTTQDGGMPIVVAGEVVGSIGISGAPQADRDLECARFGVGQVLPQSTQ